MNETEFWTLFELPKLSKPRSALDLWSLLTKRLNTCSKTDLSCVLRLFDEKIVQAYSWNLWAVAWIVRDKYGNFGCGDDQFYSFRAGLVCQGIELYSAALNDPDNLAIFLETELCKSEDFSSICTEAYRSKFGEPDFDYLTVPPARPYGEEWNEDDLSFFENNFPKCIKRWGLPST